MSSSISWFVARRYLAARRQQAFISLISAVSILGVGVGVMALIIALALMTGVQSELRDRIVGSTAHMFVYGAVRDVEGMRQRLVGPDILGAAPAIMGGALIFTDSGGLVEFGTLKGIDPAHEAEVVDIATAIERGSLGALVDRPADSRDGVVLGADLANALGVVVGDIVWVATAKLRATPGGLAPHMRPLEVVGTFRFGFYQTDRTYALVTLGTAAGLLKDSPDAPADMLQLKLVDLDRAQDLRDAVQRAVGPEYQVSDWTELNRELYSALALEKIAISLTIGLIVIVAALNIVASLVLLVMEKTRDIGILRTMGARAGIIRRIFIYQGLVIGLIGTAGGTVLGLVVSYLAERYELITLPADVYQIPYLPFRVEPLDVAVVVVAAIAVCLLATLYPSRQAARIDPAEALRNQ
jgi:lipoprotein-releasing system permease protein